MEAKQIINIIVLVHVTILGFTIIGACLYAIPLCFIRRFHKPVHLLTLNVCVATFVCSIFWFIFYTMSTYYPRILWNAQSCLPILYFRSMVNIQLFFSFCTVSLNRLFTIVYKNKPLFRTQKWAGICVSIQWILGTLVTLPIAFSNLNTCLTLGLELKYRIYGLIIGILIPTICSVTTNSIIFIYTRGSTRRIQPTNGDNGQTPGLRHRDARLLKHMIFMIATFVCSWTPIYIMLAINWNGTAISPVIMEIFLTVPVVNQLVQMGDLFLYNHELRQYFINRRQIDQTIRQKDGTQERTKQ